MIPYFSLMQHHCAGRCYHLTFLLLNCCQHAPSYTLLFLLALVHQMGFPPPEKREGTAQAIGQPDMFGTGMTHQQVEVLQQLESESEETMFVILSDVHLDKV